ncbi:hypothetical protein QFZ49_005396 [Streptomyces turgidiscabies]|uniref:UspA domain-containing protein n=1 Tax=Streptomyces turgidiscabies TaxID=85558 RepID=A0ABU0RTV6_9ACTN|nr:hypothetical protein [Streptomyces turgidiscabies]
MTSRHIVVGVNGSLNSVRASDWAAAEAERHGVALRVLRSPTVTRRNRSFVPRRRGYGGGIRGCRWKPSPWKAARCTRWRGRARPRT